MSFQTRMLFAIVHVVIVKALSLVPGSNQATLLVSVQEWELEYSPAPVITGFEAFTQYTRCVPWNKKQQPPPYYKDTKTRLAKGDNLTIEVHRSYHGKETFQGYMFQLEFMNPNDWAELGVTPDREERSVFQVVQSDENAVRLAAPDHDGSDDYKLILHRGHWIYFTGELTNKDWNTQLNFPMGVKNGVEYYVMWFGSTQSDSGYLSALNVNDKGEGNVKDSGYTAWLRFVKEDEDEDDEELSQ
ncbi:hypothetical protein F5890DRAFT_1557792 [Lentinula detonsa]|uniref:Uncharacterized protein n=1 Tax=Lentinula detonsa TaxID=2804962 RepID=A0AA38UMX9_9AGAR|nr:hypothetical protein F5890DRAFT_1557792 [Lentinula detonsa]